MSDHIPFEIQEEIMRRLPVKSLLQFRSVSKSWRSLIDSADFIAGYSGHHTQPQRLLVKSRLYRSDFSSNRTILHCTKRKYVSIVDDHTLSKQKVCLPKSPLVNMLERFSIIGSSQGLLCLYGYYGAAGQYMAVLWNISIRKALPVVVPNVASKKVCRTDLGFGVCRETRDPKIVKITHICRWTPLNKVPCIPRQVEVFTLSDGAWRSSHGNLPRKSIRFGGCKVVIDGCLYWLANERNTDYGSWNKLIISFDMTSEEFTEVNLPKTLARYPLLSMFKLKESLVVVQRGLVSDNNVFTVWMMEDRVPKEFTKMFTFNVNKPNASSSIIIHAFRKSGEPIIEIEKDNCGQLVVFEPYTKHIDNLAGMNKRERSFSVHPYMETLLLLDKPDGTVYNERGTLQFEDGLF